MVFMDPVTTTCEACGGSRYSDEALSYLYKGKNIVEILDMSAEEAEDFFSGCPKICKALHAMVEVGLSYLSLGQPLSTLSGGERQRVKLAKYLGQKGNIYVLYAAVSMALVFPMAAVFWGVRLPGSPAAFLGSWLLTLVSTLSIGMMLGGIAKNEKMASVIACLLYFPMLVFSGATLPFEVMPEMMQKIVALFPLTQGIQLMKAAFLGIHMESVWTPAAVMGTVTTLCAGAAVKFFKWE